MESTEVRCVKLKLVFMITSQVSNFEILDIWTSARHSSLLLNRIAQLEGPYKDHQFQPPHHSRVNQKFKHVIKDTIQMPPEH